MTEHDRLRERNELMSFLRNEHHEWDGVWSQAPKLLKAAELIEEGTAALAKLDKINQQRVRFRLVAGESTERQHMTYRNILNLVWRVLDDAQHNDQDNIDGL